MVEYVGVVVSVACLRRYWNMTVGGLRLWLCQWRALTNFLHLLITLLR